MKIKTSELEGAALDWAVAAAIEIYVFTDAGGVLRHGFSAKPWSPSADWGQGGPLIERSIFKLEQTGTHTWLAWLTDMQSAAWRFASGPAPLIAAMRAIVASELGDTVDVPEELS